MSILILSLSSGRMTVSWSLCEIEERLAELQNLAQNHVEDGSRSSDDVERGSTLASTVAMLESRLSALDEHMDAVEP